MIEIIRPSLLVALIGFYVFAYAMMIVHCIRENRRDEEDGR